jgi:hypothetical protein
MNKPDPAQTQILAALFAVQPDKRDEGWRRLFYAAVPHAAFAAGASQRATGPDGFPYLQLVVPDGGEAGVLSLSRVLDDCLAEGLGLAIFSAGSTDAPAWVFTYGNLLSFSIHGTFDGDPAERRGVEQTQDIPGVGDDSVLIASPSERYLPTQTRKIIGDFFRNTFRHPDPRIALIIDPQARPARSLMVNLTREDYRGDEEKLRAALYYLSWFLPPDYDLMAMPAGWKADNFVPLA